MNKPAGSKLINFKEWLTLPDAAKQLSSVCNEEVTEANILQFALKGSLKLSVNFVNDAIVARKILFPICSGTDLVRNRYERLISFGREVRTISGVYDLPMNGGERLDVEHEFWRLSGGPAVTRKDFMTFVKDTDGKTWQLQERFGYAEHNADLKAYRDELKQLVTRKSINLEKGKELMMRYYDQMKPFRERIALLPESEYCYYYPAKNLPQDSILVVRTEALREFEQLIKESLNEQIIAKEGDTTTQFPWEDYYDELLELSLEDQVKAGLDVSLVPPKSTLKRTTKLNGWLRTKWDEWNKPNAKDFAAKLKPFQGLHGSPVKKYHGWYPDVVVEWQPNWGSTEGSWGTRAFQNKVSDFRKEDKDAIDK